MSVENRKVICQVCPHKCRAYLVNRRTSFSPKRRIPKGCRDLVHELPHYCTNYDPTKALNAEIQRER